MKNTIFAISALIALLGLCGCDEDSSSGSDNNGDPKSFSSLCANSGGEFKDGLCVCSGKTCDAGVLCNAETKSCPVQDPDACKSECERYCGTKEGDTCNCADVCESCKTCPICEKCPDSQTCDKCPDPETVRVCINDIAVNDQKIAGQLREYTGAEYKSTSCTAEDGTTPVSCSGDKCGECLNYETKCVDDPVKGGTIYICQEGQWVPKIECTITDDSNPSADPTPVSCRELKKCEDKDMPCTHLNENICGECINGDFKCEDGNVPEDFSYFAYDSTRFTIPQGFIIGMRSKCINGKWEKLAIDDSENCFFGDRPDSELPSVKVGTKDVVTVFGYDSYGHSTGREYRVSMCAADGKSCGTCFYSFSYCSNRDLYTCRKGEVEKSTCSNGDGCATGNTCYPSSTKAYCNGDSCQNCKSICNW